MSELEIRQRCDALLVRRAGVQNQVQRPVKGRRLYGVRGKSKAPIVQFID